MMAGALRASGRRKGNWRLSMPLLLVLSLLIVVPAGFVLLAAFSAEVPRPGNDQLRLTLRNLAVLGEPAILRAALNSLRIGVLSTALALAIGGFLAFVTARTDIPARRFIYLVGLIPMFLPSYVGALAWSMLGSPAAGLLNVAARDLGLPLAFNMYSVTGVVMVLGLYYAPYAFLLVYASMSMMNPDLEDAATVHGASPWRTLFSTTFPLSLPAIVGAALLVFVLAFENFPVAQALATPGRVDTLPTFIYRMMNNYRGNEAAALAVLLVAIVVLLTWAQHRMLARRSFTTVSGKGVKAKVIQLGTMRWVAFGVAMAYFLATVILPLGALFLTTIRTSPYMSSFAALARPNAIDVVTPFRRILGSEQFIAAMGNSIFVSVLAALVGTILAFAVGYAVYRTAARGRSLLEAVSMVPLAIPAIVLGMGLLWTWLVMPIPLYGTLWVLVVAFLAAQMPQGLRAIAASIRATDKDLEDSAVLAGAHRARAIVYVTVPLMRTAIVSSFLLLLILSMRELTVPLFLYTRDTEILSILIFDKFENAGALQEAAALSLIYCAVMLALSYLPLRFGRALNH